MLRPSPRLRCSLRLLRPAIVVLVLTVGLSTLAACDDDDDDSPGGTGPTDGTTAAVELSDDPELGRILTDGDGRTLYYFARDLPADGASAAVSNCVGGCVDLWPIFHADEIEAGADLSASDFGEIVRSDGAKQTTYKGWPLYYFANDDAPGDTEGDDFNDVWYVLTEPFYTVMQANDDALGGRLIDAQGRSLYYFSRDVPGSSGGDPTSNCVDGCLDVWPVFDADPVITTSEFDDSDFGRFMRSDGSMQTTFRGWPLYEFASDAAPGDVRGDGVNDIWYAVPDDDDFHDVVVMDSGDDSPGLYLADDAGLTLYWFTQDTPGDGTNDPVSACTSATCLQNWPVFHATDDDLPSLLDSDDLGEFERSDGTMQSTYRGRPLYYFGGDTGPGQRNGDGVNGVWFTVAPDDFSSR